MALFDDLIIADETPKVVDVSAHAYEPFFNLMEQIGFASEAPRQSVEPVILFAANAETQSVKAYAKLRERFPDLTLAPVYNDGIVRGYSLRGDFPAISAVALPLRIPMLSPMLRAIIEAPPFSFAEFRRRPPADISELLEAELNSWLKRMHLQFREMELLHCSTACKRRSTIGRTLEIRQSKNKRGAVTLRLREGSFDDHPFSVSTSPTCAPER